MGKDNLLGDACQSGGQRPWEHFQGSIIRFRCQPSGCIRYICNIWLPWTQLQMDDEKSLERIPLVGFSCKISDIFLLTTHRRSSARNDGDCRETAGGGMSVVVFPKAHAPAMVNFTASSVARISLPPSSTCLLCLSPSTAHTMWCRVQHSYLNGVR